MKKINEKYNKPDSSIFLFILSFLKFNSGLIFLKSFFISFLLISKIYVLHL